MTSSLHVDVFFVLNPPHGLVCCGMTGCANNGNDAPVWTCKGHSVCGGPGQHVLYGWGKDAPAMTLPPGVGFHVGGGSAIRSLVLQVRVRVCLCTCSVCLCVCAHSCMSMPEASGLLTIISQCFSAEPRPLNIIQGPDPACAESTLAV